MNYFAHMLQYPNKRTEKIIVFKGWTGTGKDTLYRTLSQIMGSKYVDITESPDSLFGNFNDFMSSKLGVFLNELEGVDGIKHQEKLKALASNLKNKVNSKFMSRVDENNYCRIFVFSNNDGCVNIQVSDRRYVIIKTGFGLVGNKNFWTTYYKSLADINWRKSLYEKLMKRDLNEYDVKRAPEGEEKRIMKDKNIHNIYKYIKYIIDKKIYEGFKYKIIKNKKTHLIKFKDFTANFRGWLDNKDFKSEYKIKDTAIKQKLLGCDNSFIHSRNIDYIKDGHRKKDRFSVFYFDDMNIFLDKYIFTDHDEDYEDYGELMECENEEEMLMDSDTDVSAGDGTETDDEEHNIIE